MFARTLALSAGLVLMSATCQAQELLNPFSWFSPSSYGSNCPNGNCGPTGYRGYPTANCPNGNCTVPAGYAPYPPAAYPNSAYRPTNVGYGYPAANCPNGVCPTPNGSYSAYRPVTNAPTYTTQPYPNPAANSYYAPAPVTQYRAPAMPMQNYNSNASNSPFYR